MTSLLDFVSSLDATRLRVARPRKFIFLCGGILNYGNGDSCSAREAFLRSLPDRGSFNGHDIILAEHINTFYPDSPYHVTNLIDLELGIAKISSSVVLFSEGVGSLAELGAFSQRPEIAERMIVLIQTHFHEAKSFVRDGPIRHLEQTVQSSVQVFDWKSHATGAEKAIDQPSFESYVEEMKNSIEERLDAMPTSQKFNPTDFGHLIMLACGLIEVAGAALSSDILLALRSLQISVSDFELRKMLFCAKSVNWLTSEQVGNHTYYVPNFETRACDFSYRPGGVRDTVRWKRDIRENWKIADKKRSRVIQRHVEARVP